MRVVYRNQLLDAVNVVVLAPIANDARGTVGDVALVEQERHALGSVELECPRGFGDPGLSGEENALKELREETGFVGERAYYLGSTFTDSGLLDAEVSFYHVPIVERERRDPEIEEAIVSVSLASPASVWSFIRHGKIRDSFTLQAIALYELSDEEMI
jgi:ADP-ribose pyrophosphatase